jgi:hypothetical protein
MRVELNEWVPWLIAAGNCGSLVLTTRRRIVIGCVVLIVAQLISIVYAAITEQTGFIAMNVVMIAISTNVIRREKCGHANQH